jgi:hypothetical protein
MPKPNTVPTWATDATFSSGAKVGEPTKVDPSGAEVQGHVPGGFFNAGWVNWFKNLVGEWLTWLNEGSTDPTPETIVERNATGGTRFDGEIELGTPVSPGGELEQGYEKASRSMVVPASNNASVVVANLGDNDDNCWVLEVDMAAVRTSGTGAGYAGIRRVAVGIFNGANISISANNIVAQFDGASGDIELGIVASTNTLLVQVTNNTAGTINACVSWSLTRVTI